jgi:hypothetical protein
MQYAGYESSQLWLTVEDGAFSRAASSSVSSDAHGESRRDQSASNNTAKVDINKRKSFSSCDACVSIPLQLADEYDASA